MTDYKYEFTIAYYDAIDDGVSEKDADEHAREVMLDALSNYYDDSRYDFWYAWGLVAPNLGQKLRSEENVVARCPPFFAKNIELRVSIV